MFEKKIEPWGILGQGKILGQRKILGWGNILVQRKLLGQGRILG